VSDHTARNRPPVAGGVRLVACQMLMDLMGVKREELIDERRLEGWPPTSARRAGVNLYV